MPHVRFRASNSRYTYGILVGRITDGQEASPDRSPHYEILVDAEGAPFRVAVNIRSVEGSEVVAFFDPKYGAPTKLNLPGRCDGPHGFTALRTGEGGEGLDFVRDGLFDLARMAPSPPDGAGVSLSSLLDAQVERAKLDAQAVVVAIGDMFDDGETSEQVGFRLGRGVHDIHMMQGNTGDFAKDNRINGDGALFVRFAGGETVALFARFATQATVTDNRGDPTV